MWSVMDFIMNKEELKNRLEQIFAEKFDLYFEDGRWHSIHYDDVDLSYMNLISLPLKFGRINGKFNCSNNQLTNLKGAPTYVESYFDCSFNKLTSIEGIPQKISTHFYCNNNNLTNLEGCLDTINGDFWCHTNKLTTLKGGPTKVEGDFCCSYNKLTSLE